MKTVVIVGPGHTFGKELIKALTGGGYRVVVLTRTEVSRDEFILLGDSIHGHVIDATNTEAFREMLDGIGKEYGSIDAFIYNPKVTVPGTGLEVDIDTFKDSLSLYAVGMVVGVQALLPYLNKGAVVIGTGGGFRTNPDPEKFCLSVGKGVLDSVIRTLRLPLAERGVFVRTLVIDGGVGKVDALMPERIAEGFLSLLEDGAPDEVVLGT